MHERDLYWVLWYFCYKSKNNDLRKYKQKHDATFLHKSCLFQGQLINFFFLSTISIRLLLVFFFLNFIFLFLFFFLFKIQFFFNLSSDHTHNHENRFLFKCQNSYYNSFWIREEKQRDICFIIVNEE